MSRIGPGTFVAVVGPSGVGKDSIIDWARSHCAAGILFPRRAITRPPGAGERHDPMSVDEFDAIEKTGAFAVSWRAHGLAYGIPASIDVELADGAVVVVNVSRAVLPELARRYERLVVVAIAVSDDIRRARLAERGRENEAEAHGRLARADPAPGFPIDLVIRNDRSLDEAGSEFVRFLESLMFASS